MLSKMQRLFLSIEKTLHFDKYIQGNFILMESSPINQSIFFFKCIGTKTFINHFSVSIPFKQTVLDNTREVKRI